MERLVSVCTEGFQFLLGIGSTFVKYTAIHRTRSFWHHLQHLHFHRGHYSRGPTMPLMHLPPCDKLYQLWRDTVSMEQIGVQNVVHRASRGLVEHKHTL